MICNENIYNNKVLNENPISFIFKPYVPEIFKVLELKSYRKEVSETNHRIPDFIIIGAPKSGTTALWHFLNQHWGIYMSPNKEPRFFTRLKGDMETTIKGDGPRLSGNYDKGLQWYGSLFEQAHAGQKTGEASSVYFCNEDSPQLIFDHNPCIKLILMLRHPVTRLYSHYWQEHKLGFNFPSFEQMVQENHPRLRYYKRVSHYRTHLTRWFKFFSREQLRIVIQEEFESDPVTHFEKILEFLDSEQVDVNLDKRYNEQVTPKNRKLALMLRLMKLIKVQGFIPNSVLDPLNKIRKKLVRANATPFAYPQMSTDLFNLFLEEYEEDMQFVEAVLDRQVTSWNTIPVAIK